MSKSYWNTSKKELLELCEKKDIFFKNEPTQKEIVHKLFDWDKDNGGLEEPFEEDEDGAIVSEMERKREGLITVIFHNKSEQDMPYVFIGLNGKSYYIPKDREVTIPKILIESVIDNAVEVQITSKKNHLGKMIYTERKIQRFPYTIVQK